MEVTDGVREGSLKVIFQSVSPRPPSLARSQSKARETTKQARLYQSPITHTTTTTTSLHYTTTLPSSSSSLHWPRRGSLTDGRGWGCHSRSVTHPRHRREKPAIEIFGRLAACQVSELADGATLALERSRAYPDLPSFGVRSHVELRLIQHGCPCQWTRRFGFVANIRP